MELWFLISVPRQGVTTCGFDEHPGTEIYPAPSPDPTTPSKHFNLYVSIIAYYLSNLYVCIDEIFWPLRSKETCSTFQKCIEHVHKGNRILN